MTTKQERFAEFLRRLAAAPAAGSYQAARQLLDATLNAVEDELSGAPFNLDKAPNDGRMYPVLDDNVFDYEHDPRIKALRSLGHWTLIAPNGAITICKRNRRRTGADKYGDLELEKPGTDGKGVEEWSKSRSS
jgi:hypothetical protein